MRWLVFSYSLPTKAQSSPRVTLWRRLRRVGAISAKTGIHLLPHRDDCVEAFQWLAQEVKQAQGEALILYVDQVDGLSDPEIVELFRAARQVEYEKITAEAATLAATLEQRQKNRAAAGDDPLEEVRGAIAKLRKRHNDSLRIDFFDCPAATGAAAALMQLEQAVSPLDTPEALSTATLAEYYSRRWVTRPRPFIDRLACAWFIRRFINAEAPIRYSTKPEPDEVAFDMPEAEFGHQGNRCSFEVMVQRFGLEKPGVGAIAEIVHELDLHDGQYTHPEADGLDTIVRGWLLMGLSDQELEAQGLALFDGLYANVAERGVGGRG